MAKEKRKVRFNVSIAGYRAKQVVDYADMPDGHRFWVNHESILGSDRICEFVIPDPEPEPVFQEKRDIEITPEIVTKEEPENEDPVIEPKPEVEKPKKRRGRPPKNKKNEYRFK